MSDASFEDGGERPLRLRAYAPEDLEVISGLAQDAVFPATEMRWEKARRRFAVLLNRFRWEDASAARRRGRAFERVRAILTVEDVQRVQVQGVDQGDGDVVLSLLAVTFEPGEDGTGRVLLTLAGDGAIGLDVEALHVSLTDVTRPYRAPSGKAPEHDA